MTLNTKIGGFMDFLAISDCNTSLHCVSKNWDPIKSDGKSDSGSQN